MLPSSHIVRSFALLVFPSNAKVNGVEVYPSGGGWGRSTPTRRRYYVLPRLRALSTFARVTVGSDVKYRC